MKFISTGFSGLYIIELDEMNDERGFFARSFCSDEFKKMHLDSIIKQSNVSFNKIAGTVRGMHFQISPHEESKLVRCTRGKIFDVVIDLRIKSATYMQSVSFELSAENRRALYIPKNFAHGFQTLEDNSEVFYEMFNPYVEGAGRGLCWNDERAKIQWPLPISNISEQDQNYPQYIDDTNAEIRSNEVKGS